MSGRRDAWGLPSGPAAGWFGLAGATTAFGTGLFYPFTIVFFVKYTGLPLTVVGAGLTAAGVLSLVLVPVAARLIDRIGALRMLLLVLVLRAAVYAAFAVRVDLVPFVLLSAIEATAMRLNGAAEQSVVAEYAPVDERRRWFSLSRLAFNGGIGAGSVLGGLLVALGDRGYLALPLTNAASFVIAALCYQRLGRCAPEGEITPVGITGRTGGGVTRVLRHRTFLVVAFLNSLAYLIMLAPELALPPYLGDGLRWPTYLASVFFVVNTALILALQLPLNRRFEAVPRHRVLAVSLPLMSGFFVAVICSRFLDPLWGGCVIAVGVAVFTIGEILFTATVRTELAALAPADSRGAFMGVNESFSGLAGAAAPLLFTLGLQRAPDLLWFGLALLCLIGAGAFAALHRRPSGLASSPEAAAGEQVRSHA